MSNETRILALFEEANPVPDISAMESEPIEPATYLATLERRSSEMTQVDAKADRKDKTKKTRVWMAVAAVILVVAAIAGVSGIFSDGSGEVPLADDPAVVDPTVTEPPVVDPPAVDPNASPLGSWSSGSLSVVFEDDEYAFVYDGVLVERGTYSTNGEALTLTSGEDSPGCAPGVTGQWMFQTADSSLTLTGMDDNCFFRAFIYGFEFDLALTATDPIDVTGLPTELDLEGKWGDDTTGIAFTGDSYAILVDGTLVDRGTFEVQTSPYVLVLDSESTDEDCATGSYGVSIGGGEFLLFEAGRVGQDSCPARSELGSRADGFQAGGTFVVPDSSGS